VSTMTVAKERPVLAHLLCFVTHLDRSGNVSVHVVHIWLGSK
jgi:hypothetical protein